MSGGREIYSLPVLAEGALFIPVVARTTGPFSFADRYATAATSQLHVCKANSVSRRNKLFKPDSLLGYAYQRRDVETKTAGPRAIESGASVTRETWITGNIVPSALFAYWIIDHNAPET